MTASSTVFSDVYNESMRASLQEIAATLEGLLSRRLVAVMIGVSDGKTISRWAKGESTAVRDPEIEQRLRVAFEVAKLLLYFDSEETVRAWFIGLNPQLDDMSPIECIASGQLKEVRFAGRAFVTGG
jgi:hypothetical protein